MRMAFVIDSLSPQLFQNKVCRYGRVWLVQTSRSLNDCPHLDIARVENNAGASAAAAGLHRPRPETVAAAAAGDPVAKFCMQHAVDYSAENALRALPVELQCRILNEGPLRASNPSAVLMSRIRKAQTLLAEMRRLGKVPV
eukprot:s400_g35.t1